MPFSFLFRFSLDFCGSLKLAIEICLYKNVCMVSLGRIVYRLKSAKG